MITTFARCIPGIKEEVLGQYLRARGYFYATVGNVTEENHKDFQKISVLVATSVAAIYV